MLASKFSTKNQNFVWRNNFCQQIWQNYSRLEKVEFSYSHSFLLKNQLFLHIQTKKNPLSKKEKRLSTVNLNRGPTQTRFSCWTLNSVLIFFFPTKKFFNEIWAWRKKLSVFHQNNRKRIPKNFRNLLLVLMTFRNTTQESFYDLGKKSASLLKAKKK